MNDFQRRALGILAVGGGAIGLSWITTAMLQGQVAATNFLVVVLAAAMFSWGIWCGVQMIENAADAPRRNAIFWLVQVPLLQTPIIGYAAFCGAQIQIFLKTSPIELGFFGSILGTQFGLNLGQPGSRSLIGINIFAAAVAAFLLAQSRYEKSRPASTSARPVGQ